MPQRSKSTTTVVTRLRVPEELMNLIRETIIRERRLHKKLAEEWVLEDFNEQDSISDTWGITKDWIADLFLEQMFGYKDE